MTYHTIHTDMVQRRFIRVEQKNYLLASYGEVRECQAIDTKPIGMLRETKDRVRLNVSGKNKTWTLVKEEPITEESFRRASNQQLRRQWHRTTNLFQAV